MDNLKNEVWKAVEGWPDYMVSNMGRIASCKKKGRRGENVFDGWHILTPHDNSNGYGYVTLSNCGRLFKHAQVHRLVALAFVHNPNPKEFDTVNHKNENKRDNRAENLEWNTHEYNSQYSLCRSVEQFDLEGNFITRWKGINVAAQALCIHGNHISSVCNNKRKTAGGFKWRYAN